ncbi:MAG: LytTR family DNA-binding domain-containing protein [Rhodobacterales bacterium]|nr:LytTR family DNA-binding domain-containing protein [Rhodobacterales bacterium]
MQFKNIPWDRKAILFFSSIVLLSLTGPFGTYEKLGLWERLVFWSIIIAGVGFFMHAAFSALFFSDRFKSVPAIVLLISGAMLAAIPGAAVVVFVNLTFDTGEMPASSFPTVWSQVVVIGAIIGLFDFGLIKPEKEHEGSTAKARLFEKLPQDLQNAKIVSLSMQDHYAEVMTTEGPHLVLIRFSDALALLDETDGTQIHRSHWVASTYASRIHKSGRRYELELTDGRTLPVSASFLESAESMIHVNA